MIQVMTSQHGNNESLTATQDFYICARQTYSNDNHIFFGLSKSFGDAQILKIAVLKEDPDISELNVGSVVSVELDTRSVPIPYFHKPAQLVKSIKVLNR